mmetsp:Transcript_44755/g.96197  ORF Transcript_44755/g.96197 Transcript_44755/m.96197 type:complete len:220 (-) Transcript_44755:169-828(-)|eukprot:CAMPEP_0206471798 /NCGR_PEP_ID=MMETSP0324_2-20121206/31791_1 /ASSEMBLY_ACC=CAM_ASM_000836 /TAXON_ID=2866 /ORGANISM="Crypthecodinium cohnii, Strain Seligo" /LENGTH=219 /DNA_ID=CAMNT_0053946219 /DNA_START=167 /DNA_END=826 /DNA_ORIENTATION=+
MGSTPSKKEGQAPPEDASKSALPTEGGTATSTSTKAPAAAPAAAAESQLTLKEVVKIYDQLTKACSEPEFQRQLRILEARYPRRGNPDHPDQLNYFREIHRVFPVVLKKALSQFPNTGLRATWNGWMDFQTRATAFTSDQKYLKAKGDFNKAMGFPREFTLRPPPEDPVVQEVMHEPGKATMEQDLSLLVDSDGDEAHEFWVEDRAGQLTKMTKPKAKH